MIDENYDKWLNLYNWLNYWKYYKNIMMEGFYYSAEIEYITEIIKNKLYFASTYGDSIRMLKSNQETLYFTTDEDLVYFNYYYDFGPLNIACLYKFCCQLNSYLCSPNNKRVVYYCAGDQNKRSNAAFLVGSYAVIYLKISPRRIYQILSGAGGQFREFIDASQGMSNYTLRLLDCFHAIDKAKTFNFFDFNDFNVMEYDIYDKIQNGDMNWLLPRKFLAFIGPTECEFMNGHPPDFYIKYFLRNDVKTVIRLNNKVYDSGVFTDVGIEHHDLFFADGTTPPKNVLVRFLDISEHSPAAIAVHCKAGLGRTGSLIGAYIIKHYRMSARETIAWMRICRPGSVIGQQQGWLEKIESWLHRQGSHYRLEHFGEGDKIPHHRYGIYSKEWPLERKRLIMQAQKNAESQARHCSKLRSGSPQRFSAPPAKQQILVCDLFKTRRSDYERKRTLADKEKDYYKPLTAPVNIDEESEPEIENANNLGGKGKCKGNVFALCEECPIDEGARDDARKRFKELGNVESYRRRQRTRDKLEPEKTQGDRLNEIKMRKHNELAMENSMRGLNKGRHRKYDEVNDYKDEKGMQGDDSQFKNRDQPTHVYYSQNAHDSNNTPPKNIKKRFDAKVQSRLIDT